MGAATFYAEAKGGAANAAFLAARNSALHQHGHNGFTGTIADKPAWTPIRDSAGEVAERLRSYAATHDFMPEGLAAFESHARELETVTDPTIRAYGIARALIILDDPRITAKRGAAGCIEIAPGHFLFFGWAPE